MNTFLVALLLTALMAVLTNEKIKSGILGWAAGTKPGKYVEGHKFTLEVMIYVLFFLGAAFLIWWLRPQKSKEGFFFEVSKGLPRCSRGYIGRPNSFEFSSSNDINCGFGCSNPSSCEKVAEDAKTNPMFGWDGITNVNSENIFGGCGCSESGMTVYPFLRTQIETPCQQTYM